MGVAASVFMSQMAVSSIQVTLIRQYGNGTYCITVEEQKQESKVLSNIQVTVLVLQTVAQAYNEITCDLPGKSYTRSIAIAPPMLPISIAD